MFAFNSQTGHVSAADTPLDQGVLELSGTGLDVHSCNLAWYSHDNAWRANAGSCEVSLGIDEGELTITVRNTSKHNLHLDALNLRFAPGSCSPPLEAADWLEQIDSRQFVAGCSVKQVGLPSRFNTDAKPWSSGYYLLKQRSQPRCILMGSVPPHRGDLLNIRALHDHPHLQGRFGVVLQFQLNQLLEPDQIATTSTLCVLTGEEPTDLLEQFGKRWALARQQPNSERLIGWNSWDYFACAVESSDVCENQLAAEQLLGKRLTHFVVDDGYQTRWGDWRPTLAFPEGLDGFCQVVNENGGVPGIWTAPVQAHILGRLCLEHPDWLVRDSLGNPIVQDYSAGPCGHLDPTHPQVYQWLQSLYEDLYKQGFRYFKIDFTQQLLQLDDAQFHDPTVPSGGLVRKVFQAVRQAVGSQSHILACGAPFESITGLADRSRISCDIHDRWSHVRKLAGDLACRWWMHGAAWNNDPDFLIVRCKDTIDTQRYGHPQPAKPVSDQDWWIAGPRWTFEEMKVWVLLVSMTAGDLMLSDHLPDLNSTGSAIIRKILDSAVDVPARPVDLYEHHDRLPSIWITRSHQVSRIALINWEEQPVSFNVPLSKIGIQANTPLRTFWTDEPFAAQNAGLQLTLPPHCCEAICVGSQ